MADYGLRHFTFKPQMGEVVPEGTDGIALWMLDTDCGEESFFARSSMFPRHQRSLQGAENDAQGQNRRGSPGSPLFRHLASVSKPGAVQSGRMMVKVINHLGNEVMKVFSVD